MMMATNRKRCSLFRGLLLSVVLAVVSFAGAPAFAKSALQHGPWRAWLESPGGELPFQMELVREGRKLNAYIINGEERILVPIVRVRGKELLLTIDYYDSSVNAMFSPNGKELAGSWEKTAKGGEKTEMKFGGAFGQTRRFSDGPTSLSASDASKISGRWNASFSQTDGPVVGVFEAKEDGTATGTFLTTTGDYRFLAGDFDGKRLRLSCFDGAHAFLFLADVQADGSLRGDFWSRDKWHETWTATKSDGAALPDPFTQTKPAGPVNLAELKFDDSDAVPRTLADDKFAGKARIIEIFGTWCPNCHDATNLLVELDREYRGKGLSIAAVAFEFSEEEERNRRIVNRYIVGHGIEYPVLLGGVADKEKIPEVIPVIDKLRSYPTFVFLDHEDHVRAIYTGFSGPATGEAYARLREDFRKTIEKLLAEANGS